MKAFARSSYIMAKSMMRIPDRYRRKMRKMKIKRVLVGLAAVSCVSLYSICVSSTSRFPKSAAISAETQDITHGMLEIGEQFCCSSQKTPICCNRTSKTYDLCSIHGPTVLDPTASTFFTIDPAGPRSPSCKVQHNSPALVFATGGYTGNFWHDFNDGFIPLFITANVLLPDQNFAIVVSQAANWWVYKYADLLSIFTKHPIITLGNDTTTHCFPSAKLGLITHGFMTINQTLIPNSKTFLHFHELLDKAFNRPSQVQMFSTKPIKVIKPRPHLVLTSRNHATGRNIINHVQVVRLMKKVGFDVVVFEPITNTSLHESYALLDSSHAFVGVHGAGLTHSLFLRLGSVFGQVVSIGVDWAANACFGGVAKRLSLEYFEYKIGVNESSLIDKYGNDSLVVNDPSDLQKKGWSAEVMDMYLKEQNVKLDLVRFRGYLKQAYKKAKKFMDNNG